MKQNKKHNIILIMLAAFLGACDLIPLEQEAKEEGLKSPEAVESNLCRVEELVMLNAYETYSCEKTGEEEALVDIETLEIDCEFNVYINGFGISFITTNTPGGNLSLSNGDFLEKIYPQNTQKTEVTLTWNEGEKTSHWVCYQESELK